MRPLFSLWSDTRAPARKYGTSARGSRPSIVRKFFLTTVIVAAAVIGIRELYGQAVENRGLEPSARPQSLLTPSANATVRRSTGVAAIPLSPQPALPTDHAAVVAATIVSPAPARTKELLSAAVMGSEISDDPAIPPALTAIPGALAKASAVPRPPAATRPPATFAMKSADGPKNMGARNVVHVAHHPRHENIASYAEALAARFGHSKELRAALQMFL
jgi:hypothetical protein